MKHDIIGIVETHANANSNFHIPNYYVYQKHRPKLKKARKYSGGLAVFIRQEIKEGVTILQSRSAEMLWIKLDKYFFKLKNNLFICVTYLPPKNSTYTQRLDFDIFNRLEQDIIKYSEQGKVIFRHELFPRIRGVPRFLKFLLGPEIFTNLQK